MSFYQATTQIAHSAVGFGALELLLTFIMGWVKGNSRGGLQRQAEACPYRFVSGRGGVRGEGKRHEEGGNPSNPGR